jgi:aromatic-L-amino-acid decarboxylase
MMREDDRSAENRPFTLDEGDRRDLAARAVAFVFRQFARQRGEFAGPPPSTPDTVRRRLSERLPLRPQGVAAVWRDFERRIVRLSPTVGHALHLPYIRTSPAFVAVVAELLTAALNQSGAVRDAAPAAIACERQVIAWLHEMVGFAPRGGGGLTVPGGSLANFTCLAAAAVRARPAARERGFASGPPLRAYASAEAHYCHEKNLGLLGIGRANLVRVESDARGRMRTGALARAIRDDLAQGLVPFCVVSTLGTTNLGACDDLARVADVCARHGLWHHVDGCYGGFVRLIPERARLAAGLPCADSLTLDPQKHYFPFDASVALVRNEDDLLRAFALDAAYLGTGVVRRAATDDPRDPRLLGPQLARRFDALKIWFAFKTHGVDAFASALRDEVRLAARFARLVRSSDDFELLVLPTLGVVLFRYSPRSSQGREEPFLAELNAALAVEARRRRRVHIADTKLRGRTALRVCFASLNTMPRDLPGLLSELREAGLRVLRRMNRQAAKSRCREPGGPSTRS